MEKNEQSVKDYLMPFLMMKGCDTHSTIRDKMKSLKDRGIYSCVVQYAGPGEKISPVIADKSNLFGKYSFDDTYFGVLDRLSDVCEELGMSFWVQDAAPFPTGNANGLFENAYPDKAKKCIIEHHVDIRGPNDNVTILVDNFRYLCNGDVESKLGNVLDIAMKKKNAGKIIGAILARRMRNGHNYSYDIENSSDVTDKISGGFIKFQVPEGEWRLFLVMETYSCGRKHYMNLLDRESVSIQIQGVHNPHYAKLKNKLNKTWAGFFYDEPEVGNTGGYIFNCLPGYKLNDDSIPLPWSDELSEVLAKILGDDFLRFVPALWHSCGENTRVIRYLYMEAVTKLIEKNYNGQVHEWCKEREIPYIGHALEDENSHGRLGCGPGHFFRMQKYQDMAGIDIVGGQIMPGCDFKGYSWYGCPEGDGEFYHYGLAKLASSEANINPNKKGHSVCEYNAVYSSISDAKLQKYLVDHLFVRGINNLIPVAVDDLPIDHGKLLFDYCRRMCTLLDGSKPVVPAAVLYHAESEWAGEFQFFHKPAKELSAAQIDYHVIPCDALVQNSYYGTKISDSKLVVNNNRYSALVIPYCRYIRKDVAEFIRNAASSGLPVYFIEKLPESYCETTKKAEWDNIPIITVPLDELSKDMKNKGIEDIKTGSEEKYLRYSHFIKDGHDHYMFVNEEPIREIDTDVIIPFPCQIKQYDVMNNKISDADSMIIGDETRFKLSLGQNESKVFICGNFNCSAIKDKKIIGEIKKFSLFLESENRELELNSLKNLCSLDLFPRLSGEIIYSTAFEAENFGKDMVVLDLGQVYTNAKVILNGKTIGTRIASPYVFDITGALVYGKNELVIKVLNNRSKTYMGKGHKRPFDALSAATYTSHGPVGILGPVTLFEYNDKNR